jgi:large conductance mechanosensitive channel
MGLMQEFREFVHKGNVMDLAIGVIIGGAFGKIVSGLVDAILMPVIGLFLGGVDFASMAVRIGGTDEKPVLLKYGVLIQASIDFLIIAFCVFLLVKAVNNLRRKAPDVPPAPPADVALLTEIRDLLKARP